MAFLLALALIRDKKEKDTEKEAREEGEVSLSSSSNEGEKKSLDEPVLPSTSFDLGSRFRSSAATGGCNVEYEIVHPEEKREGRRRGWGRKKRRRRDSTRSGKCLQPYCGVA